MAQGPLAVQIGNPLLRKPKNCHVLEFSKAFPQSKLIVVSWDFYVAFYSWQGCCIQKKVIG